MARVPVMTIAHDARSIAAELISEHHSHLRTANILYVFTDRCPFDIKPDGERTGTSHWRTCRDRPGRGKH